MKRFNLRASFAALVFVGAVVAPAAQAGGISGGLNVGAGIVTGNSGISGTTTSTAVSNLSGTGTSQYSTTANAGGNTFVGGTIGKNGMSTSQMQSSYTNVNTAGSISGNAQPLDSTGLIANGAGSYANVNTAANVSGSFAKFGAAGDAFAKGF